MPEKREAPPLSDYRLPTALGLLFALAYTQPPAYYSNQHQYFLHGLAQAGYGNLADDWLANTADPTPVFSAGIALGSRIGSLPFQVVQFAAIVLFFLSVWKLTDAIGLLPKRLPGKLLFAGLFTLSHSAILRVASLRLLGADYPWFAQCGLANQYVLGAGLQPSVVGVLLVSALALYVSGRPVLACGLAAGVNVVHATYLLPSAILVAGMLAGELRTGRPRDVLRAGGLALLIALPVAAFQFAQFGPTRAETFAEAQRIIADERIPHHARFARWFDGAAGVQLAGMFLAIFAARSARLKTVLAVAFGLMALGTLVAALTEQPTLELLFPWRVSAVLVPVSTAVLLTRLTSVLADRPVAPILGPTLLAVCLLGAGGVYAYRLGYREPESEDPVLEFVQRTKRKGDVYLTPARYAKPTTAKGVYSLTFAPPTDPTAIVYFELARFRLATGAAQYIDFKSIPYRDVEVLEWHRRVGQSVKWFANPDWDASGTIDEVRKAGVTHVVAPGKVGLKSKGLELVREVGAYCVYKLR